MEDPYSVENIDRLGDLMFQTSDNSQLLRRVLWISAELTIVSSLKHKNKQPLYIFNRVRVLHLDRLKEGTWLHSFEYRKAHGCFLLDFIYKASCSGVANVREAMQRMLHECHKVSKKFKQCSNSSNFQRTSYQVHLRSIRI